MSDKNMTVTLFTDREITGKYRSLSGQRAKSNCAAETTSARIEGITAFNQKKTAFTPPRWLSTCYEIKTVSYTVALQFILLPLSG